MEAGGTHISSGRVIGEAFENYRNYAGPLLAGALVVVGIAGVISGVLEASDSLLLTVLGMIVYIAAGVLYTGYVVKLVQDVRDGRRDHSVKELFEAAAPYIGTLILNGILAAIGISIGLALLIVPGLIGSTGMPILNAVGTSLIAVTAFGLTTAANYAFSGLVDWPLAFAFIGGGVIGGLIGTRIAKRLGTGSTLTTVFATLIFVVAAYMLWKSAGAFL